VGLTLKTMLPFTIFGLSAILLLAGLPFPVHAASALVQQNNAECFGCSSRLSVSFLSNAVSGDVVVVGVVVSGASFALTSLADSLGSTFTQGVASSNAPPPVVYIYYATLGKSGAEVVTATFAAAAPLQSVYVYEVSGVKTGGLAAATGTGTSTFISTSSSVAFDGGAFLLGVIGTNSFGANVTGGAGFVMSTINSGRSVAFAEYSISGVASPSNFQATSNSALGWAEDAIALMPN